MHDIRWIREHPDEFDRGLARRGLKGEAQHLISIDERRRAIIRVSESWKARRNAASKEIGQAKVKKDEAVAQKLMAEVAECKTSISTLEAEERQVSKELEDALAQIPNLPLDEVPDGKDSTDNVEHHHFGAKRNYGFAPKQHFDLGEALGQMDFQAAAKLSGARFVVLKGGLARLERALGQFMLDLHTTDHGYMEVNPPLLVRDAAMYGTAQLPKFEDDQFWGVSGELLRAPSDEEIALLDPLDAQAALVSRLSGIKSGRFGLIPTAEVPLTNLVRESMVDEKTLPLRFTAGTLCFRA
jgi:seryl-tRNA synthetase